MSLLPPSDALARRIYSPLVALLHHQLPPELVALILSFAPLESKYLRERTATAVRTPSRTVFRSNQKPELYVRLEYLMNRIPNPDNPNPNLRVWAIAFALEIAPTADECEVRTTLVVDSPIQEFRVERTELERIKGTEKRVWWYTADREGWVRDVSWYRPVELHIGSRKGGFTVLAAELALYLC